MKERKKESEREANDQTNESKGRQPIRFFCLDAMIHTLSIFFLSLNLWPANHLELLVSQVNTSSNNAKPVILDGFVGADVGENK